MFHVKHGFEGGRSYSSPPPSASAETVEFGCPAESVTEPVAGPAAGCTYWRVSRRHRHQAVVACALRNIAEHRAGNQQLLRVGNHRTAGGGGAQNQAPQTRHQESESAKNSTEESSQHAQTRTPTFARKSKRPAHVRGKCFTCMPMSSRAVSHGADSPGSRHAQFHRAYAPQNHASKAS